jgi:hypothetical protein
MSPVSSFSAATGCSCGGTAPGTPTRTATRGGSLPWKVVSWWRGTADPERAIRALKRRGYDLNKPSPVPIDEESAGPFPGVPDLADPI